MNSRYPPRGGADRIVKTCGSRTAAHPGAPAWPPTSPSRPTASTGQAVVTLRSSATGIRRDVYLGLHDTPESRTEYGKVLARWEDNGRVLDGQHATPRVPKRATRPDSVAALVLAYWRDRKASGISEAQLEAIHVTLRVLRSVAGRMPAVAFGPKGLTEVRDAMIAKGWARGNVNARVRIVQQALRFWRVMI